MKNCSSPCICCYKQTGASCYEQCTYQGYCDYQLPRDSRVTQRIENDYCQCMQTNHTTNGICPVCGKRFFGTNY